MYQSVDLHRGVQTRLSFLIESADLGVAANIHLFTLEFTLKRVVGGFRPGGQLRNNFFLADSILSHAQKPELVHQHPFPPLLNIF